MTQVPTRIFIDADDLLELALKRIFWNNNWGQPFIVGVELQPSTEPDEVSRIVVDVKWRNPKYHELDEAADMDEMGE